MEVPMKLWLDDVRPAPEGWTHVKTVAAAKAALLTGEVEVASLDHDLGLGDVDPSDPRALLERATELFGSRARLEENGSTLVRWMAETGHWPRHKPRVHSANPVGAEYMRAMIERYFPRQ
jgi:hypothetical protein